MYFYIDESGNTGNNLFDKNQPNLFYGLISSTKNLDVVAEPSLVRLRKKLNVDRLHANQLGNKGLLDVVDEFIALQKRHDIRFNMYKVVKTDHAAMCFFDQVFDAGMNEAVPWEAYWTPMRYFLLLEVAKLFDDTTAKKAWSARISLKDTQSEQQLIEVCEDLKSRLHDIQDLRLQEITKGALLWAQKNPDKIAYNASFKDHALQVSPNLVGFQHVMQGMANRTKSANKIAKRIVVDQQNEFNNSQKILAKHYKIMRDAENLKSGPDMPKLDFSGMPDIPLSFVSSQESAGLEIVDVYLWIIKRIIENKEIAPKLRRLMYGQRHRGYTDEISLQAIEKRWSKWKAELPQLTEEQLEGAKKLRDLSEKRRLKALSYCN